jgi:chaperone modulatory protein CbpM
VTPGTILASSSVTALFPDLGVVELESWIEHSWIEPEPDGSGGWSFQAIDVARVRLIYDLRRDLALTEETVPLVLSLLDQVYELRAQLKAVTGALDVLPEPLRTQLLAVLDRH